LWSWQGELLTYQLADQPESRQVLSNLNGVADSTQSFARTADSLPNLIHQGTLIPCDFIAFAHALTPLGRHHDLLLANRIVPELERKTTPQLTHDSSTNNLIRRYRKMQRAD
jgi:glucose-6-phosphate isomerase